MNEYSHIRVYFKGGGMLDEYNLNREIEIDSPNEHGGIGQIIFHGRCDAYFGKWFHMDNLSIQLSEVQSIFAITLCDEDMPILLWKDRSKSFTYKYWKKAAAKIQLQLGIVKASLECGDE